MTVILEKTMLPDLELDHLVVIPWGRWDTIQNLQELQDLAQVLFGPPGYRYQFSMIDGHMTCVFCNPQDTLLFKLKFFEYL